MHSAPFAGSARCRVYFRSTQLPRSLPGAMTLCPKTRRSMQIVALTFLGGVLGISAMIPLRRILIVDADNELPFPEGTACAQVLRVTESGARHGACRP